MKNHRSLVSAGLIAFAFIVSPVVMGDEGMWLLNQFPEKSVQKAYGFKVTPQWLDHVRLSSARLAKGCSGSFISDQGLVMTNHHCAHSCIEQLSKSGKDFIESGFYAKSGSDEVKCPEVEVNQLIDIKDVTSTIQKATQGLDGLKFNEVQKGWMSKIEKECAAGSSDIRCDVVTLYHGGAYHLYKYKRFQDVRLVFAPEFSVAFFGGDPDNFMFPRYDLDLSLLRVYDQGHPLKTEHFFKWSSTSAKPGDLTFVTGHPGKTSRLLTVAELEYQRDTQLIQSLLQMSELRGILTEFQNRGEEQKRISGDKLFGVENTLKAYRGKLAALLDKKFFAKKVADEIALRKKVNSNPSLKKEYGMAWDEIEKAENSLKEMYAELSQVEFNRDFNSKLYGIAKSLVRGSIELSKPNEARLREFADSKIPEIKQNLFSSAPIYKDFEILMLTFSLTKMRERLTADHPFIKELFGKKSPLEIATSIVNDTKITKISERERLFEGGVKAIGESKDPMIRFALAIEPFARGIRNKYESTVEPIIKKNSEKIAKAQFAIYGSSTYPDATFTLRASYGQIKGYSENGHSVDPIATFAGAFERHTGSDPFKLPDTWLDAKSSLNLSTPLNFCTTNDIIGGNSGSPVINKDAEIVGLIFDGNIQSLGGDYGFDETVNRAVAVHSAGMIEALQKIYKADRIVSEIKK